jgi:hypothetical protein
MADKQDFKWSCSLKTGITIVSVSDSLGIRYLSIIRISRIKLIKRLNLEQETK